MPAVTAVTASPPALAAARRLLQAHFRHADFRPAQRPVVAAVLAGRDVLAVLPTGGGKSVCFQVPAMLLPGVTLVVSPLISLMQDQVSAARGRGLPAARLDSTVTPGERLATLRAAAAGELRLLYVSPEGLPRVAGDLATVGARVALLAVDEAHCVSEWGHDFRTSYRALGEVRRALGAPPAIALTGSATPAVRADIRAVLGLGAAGRPVVEQVASFDRPNLRFAVRQVRSERDRLSALVAELDRRAGLAIVYAATRNSAEGVARAIGQAGFRAATYHAGMQPEERTDALRRFLAGEVDAVAATCAFGMGIDKPDVRTVIHWCLPATPESYYQEAGRAGRDGRPARCMLLYRPGDVAIHRRQVEVTFPRRRVLERLWADPSQRSRHPSAVVASADRLRAELLPGQGPGPVDWARVDRRRQAALDRIAVMERYAEGRGCRRRALVGYFGEALSGCAGCDRCLPEGPPAPEAGTVRRSRWFGWWR